jgi:heme-degrading monooxygenase HmoA
MRTSLQLVPAEPLTARPTVTLINVYKAQPGKQDELLRHLDHATESVTRHMRGFLGATFHKGIDGRTIANYAEWESVEAWRAMAGDPRTKEAMAPVFAISTCQPQLFETTSVHWPEE